MSEPDTANKLAEFKLEVERRFSRIEKLILALGLAVISPKVGGPDVSKTVALAIQALA